MVRDNGYWMWTEHGYVYVYQSANEEAQTFHRRWRRHTMRIFLLLALIRTLYFFGPFPHLAVGGFVLHP
jgi:hypothetical protein